MGLEKYNELRKKVVDQMHDQVKDVKTIMVEQWAKNNGFEKIAFNNYDEAQKWINENVNTKRKLKRSFYKFETEADDALTAIMQELEEGSSNVLIRKLKHISNKYVSPIAKIVLKSIIISQVSGLALKMGLTVAGNIAHMKALDAIDKFKLLNFTPDLHVDVPQIGNIVDTSSIHLDGNGKISGAINNVIDSLGNSINSIPQEISSNTQSAMDTITTSVTDSILEMENSTNTVIKHGLLKNELNAKYFYDNSIVPAFSKVSGTVLGLFDAKHNVKKAITQSKKEKEKLENEKDSLAKEKRSDDLEDRIKKLENEKENDKKKNQALLNFVANVNGLTMQEIQIKLLQIIAENDQKNTPDTLNDKIEKKKNMTSRNVGKIQQSKFTISKIQKLFKEDGITIPDMPEDIYTMRDYGIYLRKYLQQNNVSKNDQAKIFTTIRIYETEIGKCCRDLKMGKCGIIKRIRGVLDVGVDELFNGFSKIGNRTQYSMKRIASNFVKHTKESDVKKLENELITSKKGDLAVENI